MAKLTNSPIIGTLDHRIVEIYTLPCAPGGYAVSEQVRTAGPDGAERPPGQFNLYRHQAPAVQLAGGHYEMPGYRWVSDDIQVGGKPYTRAASCGLQENRNQ